MRARRFFILIVSLVFIPIVLFHFQNCERASVIPAAQAVGSLPQVIESDATNSIQFVTPQAEVRDDAPEVSIEGFCSPDLTGAHLNWTLWTSRESGVSLASGTADCDNNGEFSIALVNVEEVVCGVAQALVIQGPRGSSATSSFVRRCQPLASGTSVPPEGSPPGTSCSIEYSPALAAEQPCVQICYRDNIVVSNQNVDAAECSSLASGLAGP